MSLSLLLIFLDKLNIIYYYMMSCDVYTANNKRTAAINVPFYTYTAKYLQKHHTLKPKLLQ